MAVVAPDPVLNTSAPVVSPVLTRAVPDVVPDEIVLMLFPYKTTQRWPEETVIAKPLEIVIGPTEKALEPAGTV